MTRILTLLTLIVFCFIGNARAELKINITEGNFKPIPIAIPVFSGSIDHAKNIADLVVQDLDSSGLFRSLDRGAFIQGNGQYLTNPHFADWRIIQSEALVTGQVSNAGSGRINVEFRLFDVYTERQIAGFSFTGNSQDWRRLAHKIADKIYERITGEKGYFDTKIMYVAEVGTGKSRTTKLAEMDQDGANHRYITDGSRLVLTPRYSPDMSQIVFMDYGSDRKTPRVYVMNPRSKVQQRLGNFKSMTFAPRYMPDGETVLMSLSESGNSSVFTMNLRTHRIHRLTQGPWIDTSPCASPDGKRIVFNSDRGGNQQLYVMNSDGSDQQRISFGGGRYATPVWSPRGDLIAFTKIEGGEFYIGIIRPDGTGERLLARGYLVEEPSWSPNGRMLIFTRQMYPQGGRPARARLFKIDLTGYHEQEVPTPNNENAVSAAWSPLIP